MVKKFENTFIRLIVLTECTSVTDTRTDGQTPHDGKSRAMLASRGNQTTKAREQSCDASAAAFVQYMLQIFSVPALP